MKSRALFAWRGPGSDARRCVACAVVLGICASPAVSLALEATASIRAGATLTDNVRLEPKAAADADFYVDLAPSISLKEHGARFDASLGFTPRILFSPFDVSESDTQNTLNANANVEAVPKTILLDANASIQQAAISPFGATPLDDGTRSGNFTDRTVYGGGAAWVGDIGSDIRHEVRYKLRHVSTDSVGALDSEATQWSASLDKAPVRQIGWNFRFLRNETDYSSRTDTYNQRFIAGVSYRVDPELLLSARGGTERNSFIASSESTTNYGLGLRWTPSSRTALSANWDHRFFGEAYSVDFSHRFRRSRISLVANRDASTYAERFLDERLIDVEGGDLLADQRLEQLYPDPADREIVRQNLLARGYLSNDDLLGIFTDRISRRDSARLTYTIFGSLNTITLAIFRRSVETVIEDFSSSLPANLGLGANHDQLGASVAHTLRLTPRATLSTSLRRTKTEATLTSDNSESTETSLQSSINQRLTARTTVSIGARYRNLDSNASSSYTERAVFGSFNHTF